MRNIAATLLIFSAVGFTVCGASSSAAAQTATRVRQVAEITDPENGADDQFGYSVAMNGNTLVVGAPQFLGSTGLAYIFVNSGGNWREAAKLTSGNSQSIEFGTSVAVGADIVVVGTPDDDDADGVIYVFARPLDGWKGNLTPTAELTVPPGVNIELGASVAVSQDGTTIVAGGPGENLQTGLSAVYVFAEPAGGWVNMTEPTATLTSSSGFEIGHSVAMSGNTIVAGEANTGNLEAAYVFVEPAGGWVNTTMPMATLTASDENRVDGFGYSVAISGSTIVAGAPFHPDGEPGTAYVFVEPETGWADMTQTAELSVPVSNTLELGTSVAVERNVVLAGAPLDAIGQNMEQGAVFAYVKPTTGWANSMAPNGSVTASYDESEDRFGDSIAISGTNVVIGAPFQGGDLQGAVYIFGEQ
jgi:hypothetical protein